MATTSIFAGTGTDEVGSDNGGSNGFIGHIFWVQVLDGIVGTVVSFFDSRTLPVSTASFTDAANNNWVLNGDSAIVVSTTIPVSIKEPIARRTNITDYDEDGTDQPITGVAAIGEGEGNDMLLQFVQQTNGVIPLWEDKLNLKDESDIDVVIEHANWCIDQGANLARRYTLRIDSELDPGIEDLIIGSSFRLVIKDQFTQEDGTFYIGRKRVTLSKEQDEEITLEVIQ